MTTRTGSTPINSPPPMIATTATMATRPMIEAIAVSGATTGRIVSLRSAMAISGSTGAGGMGGRSGSGTTGVASIDGGVSGSKDSAKADGLPDVDGDRRVDLLVGEDRQLGQRSPYERP